ncbi:hypothetical protein [Arthrobacter antibioticus]|uniref:hypothetical protein n=1 Tax=Arthrobacter sp. H35-MC1 TaxID=3046203 RepID=UPI0024BBB825|nr:hypothetical protein [Arthrobacter sp. H35-MC1]MDJ0318140.1 hypothetical protein [Arthrobacter sp. H35-MC1]
MASSPSEISLPKLPGKTLATFASERVLGSPEATTNSGGSFEANGAGLQFNINCQGRGTVDVSIDSDSGQGHMSSFNIECVAGHLSSMTNQDFNAHGLTQVRIMAPDGVDWAMAVGTLDPSDAPGK